jgi:hypothetical protein
VRRLAHPAWHEVFSREELLRLCQQSGLHVDRLSGCIGSPAILAKQLAWAAARQPTVLRAALYPVEWAMTTLDHLGRNGRGSTLMWLLTARRRDCQSVGGTP